MYEPRSANNKVEVASSSGCGSVDGNNLSSVTAQRRRELQLRAEQQFEEQVTVTPLRSRNGDEVAL
ncbi:zinc/cadmium resistance protein [Drosophila madeirensis]|uniref:Zinc/cadmium resistance protein n=1 Tax=Drosophila madeirensis TaxID=30013 RepID=A0AAU9FVQ6_DROMD